MKISNADDYDAINENYEHYLKVLHLIDNPSTEWKLEIAGIPLCHRGYDDNFGYDAFTKMARAFAKSRLNALKLEFESIGVVFDHAYGVPEDVYREWFGDEAWEKEAQYRAKSRREEEERMKRNGGS
jgi:hypothetical protein